mgnify:CR=1 FL=1
MIIIIIGIVITVIIQMSDITIYTEDITFKILKTKPSRIF